MSKYYKALRLKNLYDPANTQPYKISRSKIDLFLNCPRCFYLDRRLGVGQPPGFPFHLNLAVDTLLKKEFDHYRFQQERHPLQIENNIDAIPFLHPKLEEWRDSLRHGVQAAVAQTNFILTGGVDDVWINTQTQELIIVDYKATSKQEVMTLEASWKISYKRQIEIYQWLFRQQGFRVSDLAFFVYCNGRTDFDHFHKKLEFDITLIPYKGKADWIEKAVQQAYACLQEDNIPGHSADCDFCQYHLALEKVTELS